MQNNIKPLLPDFIKNASMLFWTTIIPQVLLLLYNCRILWLISAEATPENLNIFGISFAIEVSLLALTLGAWYFARKQKVSIRWPWFLILLIGQIGYLWFFTTNLWHIIPANVDRWIVDEGTMSFYAFTLVVPGIFYAGIRLACFELHISRFKDFGFSLVFAIIAPALFYFIFIATTLLSRGKGKFFFVFFWPLVFVVLTVLMFIGLIRLMVLSYNWISERGDLGQMLFAVLIGIVGPIAGLSLNRLIPFPVNFQSLAVYVMAIVNGVIVLLPPLKKYSKELLFLRSSTYPFTLYFFLVFLPFLPISLLAIFALGSGFLILVPVLLFVLHTKKLVDDFKICAVNIGTKISILLIILGVSILPGYFLWQASSDKCAINQALRYVYSPDYKAKQEFKGNIKSTCRALLNLKRFKDGLQLPYISDMYNGIVFQGMVLPDEKIAHMFYVFSGQDIKDFTKRGFTQLGGFGMFPGRARRTIGRMQGFAAQRIDHNVSLESIQTQFIDAGDYSRAKVHLTMRNTGGSNNAEFLTNINMPYGVIVTAFRLKVDKEMASGKIFERRAAQWVYHMIRDFTNRDPGVLFFKNPGQLELRVFPFTLGQVREAEIELEFPKNFYPAIKIGAKVIELPSALDYADKIMSAQDAQGNAFLFVTKEQLKKLPAVKREPYFYFILDRSRNGLENLPDYASYIEAVSGKYPEVKYCYITAANFSTKGQGVLINLNQKGAINAALKQIILPRQGGFDLERAVKQEILRYAKNLNQPKSDADWQTYPVFVAVSPDKTKISEMNDLGFYRNLIPEGGYYFVVSGQNVEKFLLWEKEASGAADVVVVAYGKQRAAFSQNLTESAVAYFPVLRGGINSSEDFLVFDPLQKSFVSIENTKKFSYPNEFIKKISLLEKDSQIILNPQLKDAALPELVKESKQLSVLIPSTAFIVVERGVQWKALNLAEKKRLATSGAFEFEEEFKTPAPSFWILLAIIAIFLIMFRARVEVGRGRFSKIN
ncbi:MAG: MSEP-CTERM sorting domain-containing protein [Candidatus Omnitrophota bacterium]